MESLGCVDVICSDKTGTLTQNRMAVSMISLGSSSAVSTQEARQVSAREGERGSVVRSIAAIAALNNDAQFESAGDDEPLEHRGINGDATGESYGHSRRIGTLLTSTRTDTGLLRFAESVLSVADLRSRWNEVAQLAFNSKNKFAIKLFKLSASSPSPMAPLLLFDDFADSDRLLLVKGAPDILLRRCSSYLDDAGQPLDLDEKALQGITAIQRDLASKGQRVLLLAKKIVHPYKLEIEVIDDEDSLIALATDLVIVGLAGLVDPLRDDTAETVRVCRRAGIRFMMGERSDGQTRALRNLSSAADLPSSAVTGDMSLTAASIALAAGIFTVPAPDVKHIEDLPRDLPLDQIAPYDPARSDDPEAKLSSIVLSGHELIAMTESQWKQVMAFDEVVFARTSPQQKLQIVKTYQASGRTVAVTGDGVNE